MRKDFVFNILSGLSGSVYWKNLEGIYQGGNLYAAKMAGLSSVDELVGKSDYDLFSKEQADAFRENDLKVIHEKKEISTEEASYLPNGEKLIQLSIKRPIFDGNKIIGIVGNTVDITYLKNIENELREAKEKAEAANAAKTEFLENMRHDIRTPLSGIVGFANIIKEEAKDTKIKEYADNLTASSQALLGYMNEILDAIKIATGEIPVFKQKFDLKSKLSDVIQLMQSKAASKKIKIEFEWDEAIPQYIVGDPKRIHRVAMELISNAITFTDDGFVKLQTKLISQKENDLLIKLIVEDSGIGIPKEKQAEIFTRFKRLTPSYQGKYKGLGLGLSIAKELIDDLGAEIYLESNPADGSKFTCIIPLKKALVQTEEGISIDTEPSQEIFAFNNLPKTASTSLAQDSHPNQKTKENPKNGGSHVLLVEDDELAGSIATLILEKLGCRVDSAKTGKEAIQLANLNHYDLIFMDIGLPDLDGCQATKAIRAAKILDGIQVPIVALTAHVDIEHKQQCIESGMNAVLTKPLAKEKAADILNEFIPRRSAEKRAVDKIEQKKDEITADQVDTLPIIDTTVAAQLIGADEATLQKFIRSFISSLSEYQLKLIKAYESNDLKELTSQAHKLRGAASYCGALQVKTICEKLQFEAEQMPKDELIILYKKLLDVIKRLETFDLKKAS